MSNSIFWFVKMVRDKLDYKRTHGQMVDFEYQGVIKTVYCPFTAEYEITKELVNKVSISGANILIYPTTWCRATREAIAYGGQCGVEVISLAEFIKKYAS